MNVPSEASRHAMKPTRWVLFWRNFILYQFLRFIFINIRMIGMAFKAH